MTPTEGTIKSVEDIVAAFDEKFVVDEQSYEIDGKMFVPNPDTRLIADYIDGKTLTAKQIEDWLRTQIKTLLLSVREEIEENMEGHKGKSQLLFGYKQGLQQAAQIITKAIEGK